MEWKPKLTRILVKREKVKAKESSIIIPDSVKSLDLTLGKVIAIGPDVTITFPGETVFFGKYSGGEVDLDGERYIIMNEDDLLLGKEDWDEDEEVG